MTTAKKMSRARTSVPVGIYKTGMLVPDNGGMLKGEIYGLVSETKYAQDEKWANLMDDHKKYFGNALDKHKNEVTVLVGNLSAKVAGCNDDLCTLVGDKNRGLIGMIPAQGEKIDQLLQESVAAREQSALWDKESRVERGQIFNQLTTLTNGQEDLKRGQLSLENKTADLAMRMDLIDWLVKSVTTMGKIAGHVVEAIRTTNTGLIGMAYMVTITFARQGINAMPFSGVNKWIHQHPYQAFAYEVIGGVVSTFSLSKKEKHASDEKES